MINLIPYNPRRNSPWPAPTEDEIEAFLGGLIRRGVFAKRRRTKGRSMMGACGQLGNEHIRGRKPVSLTISAENSPA
jgi:23S rRNA (adenine2503-C2)-methyltransferase